MSEQLENAPKEEENKSQAQKDYDEGQEFLKNGDKSQAANAFHNALIGFQQEGKDNGIANCSDKLGDICYETEKYEQALQHWDTASKICEKASDRFSIISIVKKRAKLYKKWQKYDQAINLYLELFDEYADSNNPQGTVDTLETLSELYLNVGKKEEAVDCLKTAAGIHKNFKHQNVYESIMKKVKELEQK